VSELEYICQYCRRPIQRVGFNQIYPIWEHWTSPYGRHGPWPRTHCSVMRGHECPKEGCNLHAVPFFEQVINEFDRGFLYGLGIMP
jgi:hypothetical protein